MSQVSAPGPADTTLRDSLALDRTLLANERTLLSYIRTALALAGGGAAIIHFFHRGLIFWTGWVLVGLGALLLMVGGARFVRVQRRLLREHAAQPVTVRRRRKKL